jgi:flagellar hook protein FlgE
MGIFGALTTAVGGMQAQSYSLENISGNIANSQTTAYKRTDTSFDDLVSDAPVSRQKSGNVLATSRSTNTVQGDVQSSTIGTFMAINGDGFFVVEKPTATTDGHPVFDGAAVYTRRGDFQPDANGYLVNGAGYYLMGLPIDPATGNPTGSIPQLLHFQSDFLPAQATTNIDYRANLASTPLTGAEDPNVPGSELLQPSDFAANPLLGGPGSAKIQGTGAAIAPDAAATATGTTTLATLSAVAGSISVNGTAIAIAAGDNAAAVIGKINAQSATTGVSAALNASNQLVLTSADADTAIAIDNTSTSSLLNQLGVLVGTNNPKNLLTQSAASAGQSLTISIGSNAPLTITFGTGAGQVSTLADLNTALAGLAGGTAAVDATGNLSVTGANLTDSITIGGTVASSTFGVHTPTAYPSSQQVIGADVPTFLDQSISGGAVTAYDTAGAPTDIQLRWAKVSSTATGGTDTWNLFYQTNSTATGTQPAWQNAGINYSFGPDGKMNPPVTSVTLPNVVVDGVSLGNVTISHGNGGITQFSDTNGGAQVNLLQQNGFPAGSLQTVSVSNNGRIVGAYSNGRTLDLASISLANFAGANFLQNLDGGAFAATDASGAATFDGSGKITGSSLEGSNTDIADEFTKLIVTQQAYSANTKVITTANTMVQDLLNVLR